MSDACQIHEAKVVVWTLLDTGLQVSDLTSFSLAHGTFSVVREAIRPTRTLVILALLLLVSPALAATTRCTTYKEKTLARLQTLCDAGTRAVSTYNKTQDSLISPFPRALYNRSSWTT